LVFVRRDAVFGDEFGGDGGIGHEKKILDRINKMNRIGSKI